MYSTVQYTKQQQQKIFCPSITSLVWDRPENLVSFTGCTGPIQAVVGKSFCMSDPPRHTSTEMSSQASSIPSSLCPTKTEVLITVTVTHPFYKMEADRKSVCKAIWCMCCNRVQHSEVTVDTLRYTCLFSSLKVLMIEAMVKQLKFGWTHCPASLIVIPWTRTWQLVARI